MSGIKLTQVDEATIPTPETGKDTIFMDVATGQPSYKDDAGVVTSLQGIPGTGVPVGGSTGQVLSKIDATNYNTQWTTPFANPMTTSQDLIVGGASGAAGRLGVGSNGQVLGVSAGVVAWVAAGGSYTGTTNRITVTGSVIDIAATYVGQTSLVTLGTVSTGIWNATVIGPTFGGTGLASYTTGDLIYASATNTLSKLAVGTNGYVLTLVAGVPAWVSGGSGGLTNWTEAVSTSAPNATVPVVSFTATNAATNVDIALVPKGNGAITAAVANNSTSGGDKRGSYAVDLQTARNSSAQVASGPNAMVLGGQDSRATGTSSLAAGTRNTASGSYAVALGADSTASGTHSFAFGNNANASANYSIAFGYYANTRGIRHMVTIAPSFSGDRASNRLTVYGLTTNATPVDLSSDGNSVAANNTMSFSADMAGSFTCKVIARQIAGTGTGSVGVWEIKGAAKRISSTYSFVGTPSVASTFADAGAAAWSVAASANNTIKALVVSVTGEASKTIQWSAEITQNEV